MTQNFFRTGISALALATVLGGCPSPFQPAIPDTVSPGAVAKVAGSTIAWGGQTEFRLIRDLAVDAKSNVYVIDQGPIRRIGPDGAIKTLLEPDGETIKVPDKLTVGPDGKVYFVDTDAHAIFALAADGTVQTVSQSVERSYGSPLSLSQPKRLRVDSQGRQYVLTFDGTADAIVEGTKIGLVTTLLSPSDKSIIDFGGVELHARTAIVGLEVTKDDTLILIDDEANAYMRDAAGKGRKVKLALPPAEPGPPNQDADRVEYRLDHKGRLVALRDRYQSYNTLLIGQFFSSFGWGPAYNNLGFDVYRFDDKGAVAAHHFVPKVNLGWGAAFDAKGRLYVDASQEVHAVLL